MRNPVSYTLKKDFTAADVYRIFDSMRRRARAAFTHLWGHCPSGLEDHFRAREAEEKAHAVEKTIADCYGYCKSVLTSTPDLVQFSVNDAQRILKSYEVDCFQKVRWAKHVKSLTKGRKSVLPNWTSTVAAILSRVRTAYPFVSKKNMHRLGNAIKSVVIGKPAIDTRDGYVLARDLLTFGIPAAEIAGPWYDKKKFKSPLEWVKHSTTMESKSFGYFASMSMRDWIRDNGLDDDDRHLRDSTQHYYEHEGHAPSVAWAQRRSRELEEERENKDIEAQLPKVEEWLTESAYWRRSADFAEVQIPTMPDPTFRVLRQSDGELLCRMARRDGLCVVDAITDIVDNGAYADEERTSKSWYKKSKEEGFVTLVISTDPKRRTVVGLNDAGICTSEHHCTGIQNKVDKIAFEYFRKFRG